MNRFVAAIASLSIVGFGAFARQAPETKDVRSSPAEAPALLDPAKDAPGLRIGDTAPDFTLKTPDGREVSLGALLKEGPVVVTFYRGGWCPYCTKSLAAWGPMEKDFNGAGATVVFISPEKPEQGAKTMANNAEGCTMLCDGDGALAKAYRLAFALPPETQQKYKGFGVDLSARNADGRWELPSPATFVIDQQGVVRWAFADWDYKKRADPNEVLAFVKTLHAQPTKN